jgi:hypothetical protein
MVRSVLAVMTAVALSASSLGAAAEPAVPVQVVGSGPTVDWNVLLDYQRAVLTVSMPDGAVWRRELAPGISPTFSAFDDDGNGRPAGSYRWELRLLPRIAPDVEGMLAEARARGDERAARRLARNAGVAAVRVESGAFALRAGVFDTGGGGVEPARVGAAEKVGAVAAADSVIVDDLIVQGKACAGTSCVTGESFGNDALRLKQPNLRIHFDDTSTAGGVPANDWRLVVNDVTSGGSNKLSIDDVTGGTTPFTILAGAPDASLFVDGNGRVGLGTSTPARDLHLLGGGIVSLGALSPALRLEQSVRLYSRAWDIGVSDSDLAIRDATGAQTVMRIGAGAPANSLAIRPDGKVGLGTTVPELDLHLFGGATDDTGIGLGPNPDGIPGTESALNIAYAGATFGRGAALFNVRPDSGAAAPNPSLRFLTSNVERMILDDEGFLGLGVANPGSPIEHSSGAVLTAGGVWQSASSRASKEHIRPLQAADALAALGELAPVRFRYKVEPDDEYVGFIAEDVPELVATPGRKTLSPVDIVAVLTKVVQEQQRQIRELTVEMQQLRSLLPK